MKKPSCEKRYASSFFLLLHLTAGVQLRKEEERRLLEARWVVKSNDDDNVILIMSEDRFDLSPPLGRRSFKGFNAALETLVEAQLREHRQRQGRLQKRRVSLADQDEAEAAAVSDDSMTAFALASKRKR